MRSALPVSEDYHQAIALAAIYILTEPTPDAGNVLHFGRKNV